jgi:dedicated sortase system histidine kinase
MAEAGAPRRRFRHSLRFKLLLLSLTLIAIPWAGYRYIQEIERFLRQAQEGVLTGTAQSMAAVLNNRPELFRAEIDLLETLASARHLYVLPLDTAIQLDGYVEDWTPYLRNAETFGQDHALRRPDGSAEGDLRFRHLMGRRGDHLYVLLQIEDDRIVYRPPGSRRLDRGDHLEIALERPDGVLERYQLATYGPGWVSAHLMGGDRDDPVPVRPEVLIKGEWQETADGYTLELRLPRDMVGDRLAFAVADVDDPGTGRIESMVGTAGTRRVEDLGVLVTPSPAIERIIASLEHESARVWVLDRRGRVLVQRGSLAPAVSEPGEPHPVIGALLRWMLPRPSRDFTDELDGAARLAGPEVRAALQGRVSNGRRRTPDGEAVIVSAAAPIRAEAGILGAVLVEQTTNAILALQNRALQRLFLVSLALFAVTALGILGYATLLTGRIRRLRDRVERAVTPDGRIREGLAPSRARDEIGDLNRSFTGVLERLAQYNRYLESMASRLAHELRTPLTVVRSSLENLEQAADPAERGRYLERARSGTGRLALILQRMREATRLEQYLQQAEPETVDLTGLVRTAAEGYGAAHPGVPFEAEVPEGPVEVRAVPDLIAQCLDKLVDNALGLRETGSPIRLVLERERGGVRLAVANRGPPLPEGMERQIFQSMVSVRPEGGREGVHLGLGLYLVRLVAEFHGGTAEARDTADGVEVSLHLPA